MIVSSYDIALLTWFNHHLIPGSLPVIRFLSESTTYINVLIALVFLYLYFREKKRERLRQFIILIVVLVFSGLLTLTLKATIKRERPFYTHSIIEKRTHGGESSFPSGHTLETFALAIAVIGFLPKRRKVPGILLLVWGILIGYSRMALGVHYPTDVLGGIVLGMLTGIGIPWLINNRVLRSSPL